MYYYIDALSDEEVDSLCEGVVVVVLLSSAAAPSLYHPRCVSEI
jgi:hypothetical protein